MSTRIVKNNSSNFWSTREYSSTRGSPNYRPLLIALLNRSIVFQCYYLLRVPFKSSLHLMRQMTTEDNPFPVD